MMLRESWKSEATSKERERSVAWSPWSATGATALQRYISPFI